MAVLVVAFVTFAAFFPVLRNQFVNWDDTFNFLRNPYYRGLSWTQIKWMFSDQSLKYGGHYMPVTWISCGFDYVLWGMNPLGYHLTGLLIHVVNAALFFFVGRRLLVAAAGSGSSPVRRDIAAVFAALAFALHPLRVESVAWATERRDVLCGLFYLLTILCYLRASSGETTKKRSWLLSAAVSFALSLLSKEAGITLPLVLLVLDVYPLRRLPSDPKRWVDREVRQVWLEKIPFFFLACAAGIMGLHGETEIRMLRSVEETDYAARISLSAFSTTFYLWKTLVPFHLLPLYALPVPFNPCRWQSLLGGAVVVALSAILFLARKRFPAGLAAWTSYLIALAPVMGLVAIGKQLAADRYTYLPCMSWALLAAGAWLRLQTNGNPPRLRRVLTDAALFFILAALGILSWRQTKIWRDSETLWRHVLSVDPKCAEAHNDLGLLLVDNRGFDEAIRHYREALRTDPKYYQAHNNLAFALAKKGNLREAIFHWRALLRVKPDYAMAQNNLGFFLAQIGELPEAILRYNQALQVQPNFAWAHTNLCLALSRLGKLPEATAHCLQAVESDPDDYAGHISLGWVLGLQGRLDEAIAQYQEALRVAPSSAEAHTFWGNICVAKGQTEEAMAHYRAALSLNPDYVDAYYSLIVLQRRRGNAAEASGYLDLLRRKGLPIPAALIH